MQNMKRIDCNVAMWRLDDVGVLILFIMVNKKKFRKSTTCETYVYSFVLLLLHIWVGTKHCCCESLLTSSLKKYVFHNWLINNILYFCVT